MEKKLTNSGPLMESTSKHSIYTLAELSSPGGQRSHGHERKTIRNYAVRRVV
jgi:hypothetical protein